MRGGVFEGDMSMLTNSTFVLKASLRICMTTIKLIMKKSVMVLLCRYVMYT